VSGRYRFGIAPIAHTFDMSISRDERHEFYGMRLLSRRVAWSKAASEMACRLGHGAHGEGGEIRDARRTTVERGSERWDRDPWRTRGPRRSVNLVSTIDQFVEQFVLVQITRYGAGPGLARRAQYVQGTAN
jgi:hypothetical protein